MNAWSGDSGTGKKFCMVPPRFQRQGALIFQAKAVPQLSFHWGKVVDKRGPALDRVALRLTQDQTHPSGDSGRRQTCLHTVRT